MFVVSITRLHLRALRFFPWFGWYTWRSTRQIQSSTGFVRGQVANEWPYAFWTLTIWESVSAMKAFRDAEPHKTAMRKLLNWCDEASFAHWDSSEAALPPLEEAHRRMLNLGRTSKVYHPSAAHRTGRTAAERIPTGGPLLRPKRD